MDISQMIDDYLKREDRPRTRGIYYASEVSKCQRELFEIHTGTSMGFPVETIRVFAVGDLIHNFIYNVLKSSKRNIKLVENEKSLSIVDIDSDICINGRADDVIMSEFDGEKYVLEVKSVKSLYFIKTNGPDPAHIDQVTIYMKALGYKRGMLLYVDKNTLETKHFVITYDGKVLKKIFERLREVEQYISDGFLPDSVGCTCPSYYTVRHSMPSTNTSTKKEKVKK